MSEITAAQALPLLKLLPQPALVILSDGRIEANPPAARLAPENAAALPGWLGSCSDAYAAWDRQGGLSLLLSRDGTEYLLTAHPLADGTLLLLSPQGAFRTDVLAATSQVLRQPLGDLASLSQHLAAGLDVGEDPGLWEDSAAITRHIYRISRILCNLADLERLRSGQYTPRMEPLDLLPFLERLLQECAGVCAEAGRTLYYQLPAASVTLYADGVLIQRAFLNLLSNALKYGDPSRPIVVRFQLLPHAVLVQMRNHCAEANATLLQDAFHRLQNRGVLPDPRWGLGLGLPLAEAVAKLHGGTAAVEQDPSGAVTVTLSFSCRRELHAGTVKMPPFDYTGGMRMSLLELCESLPTRCFADHAL